MIFIFFAVFAWDLTPMMPPPHLRFASAKRSLYEPLIASTSLENSILSSFLIAVSASAVAVFLCTTAPRRALPLTMQYGTFICLHSAGSQITSSTGSTSCAMHTSCALPCSTRYVMWLIPNFTTTGFLASTSLPAASASACAVRRSFFCASSSGRYFMSILNRFVARFLSSVLLNWLIAGGTLRRFCSTRRARCRRTYLGHLT